MGAKASLPEMFGERYQVEAADYSLGNIHERCLGHNNSHPWTTAHRLSDRRLATRLCWRRQTEQEFVHIATWWNTLDPSHFVSVKQGTLLTAMIRGGETSMMPWDNDLELGLYSTEANPVLGWCGELLSWKDRNKCIVKRLESELGMPCGVGPDFLSSWLYEEHLALSKLRVSAGDGFDLNFEGWVPRMPIVVRMFGAAEVLVSWPLWEHLFFEVFMGGFDKKVGTSGNVAHDAETCAAGHNACISQCEGAAVAGRSCIIEFDDYFAHVQDPYGDAFPLPPVVEMYTSIDRLSMISSL